MSPCRARKGDKRERSLPIEGGVNGRGVWSYTAKLSSVFGVGSPPSFLGSGQKENDVVEYAHSSRFESLILPGTVMLDLALFLTHTRTLKRRENRVKKAIRPDAKRRESRNKRLAGQSFYE